MGSGKNIPLKVLIIEDDADILNALNLVLGAEGFDVDVLQKGSGVLQNQFVKPDLFILDYRLPDIDGLAICRYLRSTPNYRDIPVIMITAESGVKISAAAAGVSFLITKPFEVNAVVTLVNNLLLRQSAY